MNSINQLIRQIEATVEHIQDTQHELVNATNSIRTDYRQYRLNETIVHLVQE